MSTWISRVFGVLLCLLATPSFADQNCFGAAGQRCGGLSASGLNFSTCQPSPNIATNGLCYVSNGSWTHDECCVANPNGVFCGGNDSSRACQVEWDRAVHRLVFDYQWLRFVDYRVFNDTGRVARSLYCARSGARIHRADASRCCSSAAVSAPFWERLGRPNLVVCR